ncbi:hypothetical protein PC128_g5191 [Phytophthora cactorum]|uniref:Uncharacterized protein n=1 Tax=Phytophthora cactorum TaxID=29920 RepID=A0A8T1EDR3_9STRA|nr:hypothetical protein PC117_g4243 [Phytophthora cactorum]KAG3186206.1 hypothetical protein C6341_g3982 [Phytophthora cactorum]KAG3199633.1 hypothetical protein PC128_g5191 [Phytophthora cactorum]KAG4051224.1 hypothetical protein PC123_g13555 [Phytophthora cactorum]
MSSQLQDGEPPLETNWHRQWRVLFPSTYSTKAIASSPLREHAAG